MTAATVPGVTKEQVTEAIEAILSVLGEPTTSYQAEALTAFKNADYQRVKRLASTNLMDYYCKSLGYLGGALKLTPNTDTILAESARAAAEVQKEKSLALLGEKIATALN